MSVAQDMWPCVCVWKRRVHLLGDTKDDVRIVFLWVYTCVFVWVGKVELLSALCLHPILQPAPLLHCLIFVLGFLPQDLAWL